MNRLLRFNIRRLFGAGVLLAGVLSASTVYAAAEGLDNETCLACHTDGERPVDGAHFAASAHASLDCVDCHDAVKETPHQDKLPKVDCSSCHSEAMERLASSDHAKTKIGQGPLTDLCVACHGEPHHILPSTDVASPTHRLNSAKTCATCHEDEKLMAPHDFLQKAPFKSYLQTVHGLAQSHGNEKAATCTDCHGTHDINMPVNPKSKIFRLNVPQTCGQCHAEELRDYLKSIHGKAAMHGKVEAPVCTDCHGEHTIKSRLDPTSKTYAGSLSEQVCGSCHAAERITTKYRLPSDRLKTYKESYHGLASRFSVATVANCASCHEAHAVLPSSDPASSVHKNRLRVTCGQCHPNVGEQLAYGSVHISPSPVQDKAVWAVSVFYIFLIVVLIGGMILHNGLDFIHKARENYRKRLKDVHVRFTTNERIQHMVLAVSFITLAYTGFALKFPDAWWVKPLAWLSFSIDLRGILHRIAAVLFVVLGVYHFFYMVFTDRGRRQIRAFLPEWKDLKDIGQTVLYNLDRTKEKPSHKQYTYIEKAEYWALVWGSWVMVITGLILVFNTFAMRYLPKWVMDVVTAIHFYEAVLATSAIVVWHFYFTIFDPDHYPLNWSMFKDEGDEGKKGTQ